METPETKKPLRVGIFDTLEQSEQAVQNLMQLGFSKDEITIVCPRELASQFKKFEQQDPSAPKHVTAGAAGGTIGSIVGAAVAVGVATTTGVGLLAVGPIMAGTGALVGGFIGLMMREGVEKELAHFYDQALSSGKILVGVKIKDASEKKTALAEGILAVHGGKTTKLAEG